MHQYQAGGIKRQRATISGSTSNANLMSRNSLIPSIGPHREDLSDDPIVQIVTGDSHNLVLTQSGKLFTFGYNNKGQCG